MKKLFAAAGLLFLVGLPAYTQPVPKVETFFGYSYVRVNPQANQQHYNANGGTSQLVFNVNSWLGVVGDFSGYRRGRIDGTYVDNTWASFMAGPRISFAKRKKVNPYIQGLVGGVYNRFNPAYSAMLVGPPTTPFDVGGNNEWGFGLLAGTGLDVKVGRHVAIRPYEVDYFLSRIRYPVDPPARNWNNLRASVGINFMFGGEKPAPPPKPAPPAMKTCPDGTKIPVNDTCPKMNLSLGLSAPQSEVCPGETVVLTPTLGGNHGPVTYQWSVNGQPTSQGERFEFGTTGRDAGSYRIGVTANGAAYNPAMAETAITVKEYRPPTGTVEATPAEVYAGDKSSLSSQFTGQCGGPIGPATYTASEGTINGTEFDSSTVRFDASVSSEQRKAVTITASASDKMNTGTATTTVTVVKKAAAGAVRLPDILFPPNSSRVNNCGKRVLLEQLRSYFERDPGGTAVIVGHQAKNEKGSRLSEDRARNAAAIITAGKGVCMSVPASQVTISAPGTDQQGVDFQPNFCAASTGIQERPGQSVASSDKAAESRRVVVWFVPSGGQMPESVTNPQTAAAANVTVLGCPK